MERIFGALALIALVGIPFWFSKHTKMKRIEDWNNERDPTPGGVTNSDTSATISSDGGHSDGSFH